MGDIVDRANDLVETFDKVSLEEHKAATTPRYPYIEDEGDFDCYECGVVVPPERRKLTGSEYCVDCKEDLDDLGDRRC